MNIYFYTRDFSSNMNDGNSERMNFVWKFLDY